MLTTILSWAQTTPTIDLEPLVKGTNSDRDLEKPPRGSTVGGTRERLRNNFWVMSCSRSLYHVIGISLWDPKHSVTYMTTSNVVNSIWVKYAPNCIKIISQRHDHYRHNCLSFDRSYSNYRAIYYILQHGLFCLSPKYKFYSKTMSVALSFWAEHAWSFGAWIGSSSKFLMWFLGSVAREISHTECKDSVY